MSSAMLPGLERDLVRTARRQARARRRRRWTAPRGLAIALVALLVGTTGALAAAGLLQLGADDPPNLHPEAFGPVIRSSVALVPVQAPDPDGGLPWGLRVFKTDGRTIAGVRRGGGMTCLQVGRLYQGQIGVLGQDGAFGDDGRFHRSGLQGQDCQPQDVKGHALIGAGGFEPRPASGYLGASGCLDARFGVTSRPVCAAGRWRSIFAGLAGPAATSVTLNTASGPITRRVRSRDEGAYLFVLKGDPSETVTGPAPYVTVTYRDGTVCPRDGRRRCRVPPGFVAPPALSPVHIPDKMPRANERRSQDSGLPQ